MKKRDLNDEGIEKLIGIQLRAGVVAASLIVLTGGVMYFLRMKHLPMPQYGHFEGRDEGLNVFKEVWAGVMRGDAGSVIDLGLVVLMATPVLRILFSLVGFVVEKDRLYVMITFVVLLILSFSIFGGIGG
ncbi:MAG: DUF1634 domain-containing protein [Bacteroidetes bacterium]|nr:DUF1634 domain-containing protein [Bacteroidota bacterium]